MKDIISTNKESLHSKLLKLKPFDVENGKCDCGNSYEKRYKIYIPTQDQAILCENEMCSKCKEKEFLKEFFKKQEEEVLELKKKKLQQMFEENSLINPKLQNATLENYHPTNQELEKAKSIAKRYADNFCEENPISLLLIGDYGTGKSHLGVAILKELIKSGYTGIFISTPKLMTKLRSTYNKESEFTEAQIIDQLTNVDCIVLDDIGAEAVKAGDSNQHTWTTSKIFEIIDNRIGKHTIFTTNYEINELQQRLGGRNFSRMMENVHVIKMYGDDYRLRNFK